MVLSTMNLDSGYGQTPVLHDVSIEIGDQEIVSLIGRNGVGKSTLIKTLIGLVEPSSGEIEFEGECITELPPDRRAKAGIGYVPQGREIFPRLTVEENLRTGTMINENHADPLYDEVYEYFPRLKERTTQKAGTMSGGEQQMLAIGRALVGNPKLLLLDELSEGVQPNIVEQIGTILKEINDDLGMTIFFTEQNIDFTINTTERCYVMEKGSIVDELGPDELDDSDVIQQHLTI
ncbi:ABC transporter ATP-binding protein [Natrarchaeobius oligotrophus]|uniref:ABC transporter ATP-binding protein n=1 Tax=Natrarchaeobius chitinivorans TaxID=1679083 RepID=A0A3N6NIG4_NATCH|nr:ABC transporter ATP-binding protein [Natrarchaeobius chitinivorans]RQG98952.1 ABC transporter ATP-binding protein [Natrarchaeobius chitinivorans]